MMLNNRQTHNPSQQDGSQHHHNQQSSTQQPNNQRPNTQQCELLINIAKQTLSVYKQQVLSAQYTISSGKNGIGNQEGSGCTPLGRHVIAQKIGADQPINTVFVGRVPTGEVYDEQLGKQFPQRDWILSRILWLAGCEQGINQGNNEQGCCDTYQRYIYIHGTPDSEPMGQPLSHGCIRMRNQDIMQLFEQVDEGMAVTIIES